MLALLSEISIFHNRERVCFTLTVACNHSWFTPIPGNLVSCIVIVVVMKCRPLIIRIRFVSNTGRWNRSWAPYKTLRRETDEFGLFNDPVPTCVRVPSLRLFTEIVMLLRAPSKKLPYFWHDEGCSIVLDVQALFGVSPLGSVECDPNSDNFGDINSPRAA